MGFGRAPGPTLPSLNLERTPTWKLDTSSTPTTEYCLAVSALSRLSFRERQAAFAEAHATAARNASAPGDESLSGNVAWWGVYLARRFPGFQSTMKHGACRATIILRHGYEKGPRSNSRHNRTA